MGRICCVVGCRNGVYKLNKFRKKVCEKHGCKYPGCECPEPFTLFPFPVERKHPEKRRQWISAINKNTPSEFKPNNDSRICSNHFKDGQPTFENPIPTQNMGCLAEPPIKRQSILGDSTDNDWTVLDDDQQAVHILSSDEFEDGQATEENEISTQNLGYVVEPLRPIPVASASEDYDFTVIADDQNQQAIHNHGKMSASGPPEPWTDRSRRRSCAVKNCFNRTQPGGCSVFRFPKDAQRCYLWLHNSRREDLFDKTPKFLYDNYRICSEHFKPGMFSCTGRLKTNAVPTIFDYDGLSHEEANKMMLTLNNHTDNCNENMSDEEELDNRLEAFTFSERPNFEEVCCIVPNCSNNVLHFYRKSKFLLYFPSSEDIDRTNAWHEILTDEFPDNISAIMSEEILSICGKHFINGQQSEEHPDPTLFGPDELSENTEVVKKAQRFCCIKNCCNSSDLWYASERVVNYYSLNLLCDDTVGRSLLTKLLSSTLYDNLENNTSFFCGRHFRVKILNLCNDERIKIYPEKTKPEPSSDKCDSDVPKVPKQKFVVNYYNWNIAMECCVMPTCPFSDVRMKFRARNGEFRPAMFTFPSLNHNAHDRIEWLRLVRAAMPFDQKKYSPLLTSKICGRHFPHGSPTLEEPNPTLLTEYVEEMKIYTKDADSTTNFIIDIPKEELSIIKIAEPKKRPRWKRKRKRIRTQFPI